MGFGFKTLKVICTDYTGSTKSNYYAITTTTAPLIPLNWTYTLVQEQSDENVISLKKPNMALWTSIRTWKAICLDSLYLTGLTVHQSAISDLSRMITYAIYIQCSFNRKFQIDTTHLENIECLYIDRMFQFNIIVYCLTYKWLLKLSLI